MVISPFDFAGPGRNPVTHWTGGRLCRSEHFRWEKKSRNAAGFRTPAYAACSSVTIFYRPQVRREHL